MKLKDVLKHELIGKYASVKGSKNKSNIGIQGKILDETQFTVTIRTEKGNKRVMKNNVVFELKVDGKTFEINGKLLVGKPEERIKVKMNG